MLFFVNTAHADLRLKSDDVPDSCLQALVFQLLAEVRAALRIGTTPSF